MRAASVLLAATAVAALPPLPERIDLDRASAIRVQLPTLNAPRVSVSNVGDVNGDGRGDIGVREIQGHAGDASRTFVVFGGGTPRTVAANRLRANGLELPRGPDVGGAGDLDQDGRGDLVLGDCNRGTLSIAYGRRARGVLSGGDYAITGLGGCPWASAGGARNTRRHLLAGSCEGAKGPGRAFLLPPRPRGTSRVHAPTAAILRITGVGFVCPIGLADVDGDRRDDAVVSSGRSVYVVFDVRRRAAVDLRSLGRRGFRITTARELIAVALAGDVNRDGRGDIVLGDRTRTAAYVVFGKNGTATVDTAKLAAAGLTIHGERHTNFPFAAAAAGDVDGDGHGDVLLGAPGAGADADGVVRGAVYLVYGRSEGGQIALSTPGSAFVRIEGGRRESVWGAGGSVASLTDMDGDRRRELAIAGGYEGVATVLLSTRLPR